MAQGDRINLGHVTIIYGTYQCQAFNTQDAKLRIGKRKYLPVYTNARGEEKYTTSPRPTWDKYLMDFPITQLKYHPFQLTNKERIPEFICRKIHADGHVAMVLSIKQPYCYFCSELDEDILPELPDTDVAMLDQSSGYL